MSQLGYGTSGLDSMRARFRESEIEADVLPELTEADLEKLGLPLGTSKANPQSDCKSG